MNALTVQMKNGQRMQGPELVENVGNIEEYDTVFLGYPKTGAGVISVYSGVLRGGRRANRSRKTQQKEKVCIE